MYLKKVLIVIPAYNMGGTNKSLENFMSLINHDKFDIEIFCMVNKGPYKKMLSKYKIVPHSFILTSVYQKKNSIIEDNIFSMVCKMSIKIIYRIASSLLGIKVRDIIFHLVIQNIQKKSYDTIIAMQEGLATEFVSHMKARNKIAWVRSIYKMYVEKAKQDEKHIYNLFDKIVCVSNYSKENFLSYYPEFKSKCFAVYNLIDENQIIQLSLDEKEMDVIYDNSKYTILSIGRLSPVKRFSIIPYIANYLKENDCEFCWYIIGSGEQYNKIDEEINTYNVGDCVKLLGEKNNPYCYFTKADLIVCTSVSESFPNIVNEAKILHKVIVSTDYPSVKELISHGVNGYISNENNLKNEICSLIKDKSKSEKIHRNTKNYKYINDDIIDVIETII